MRHLTVPRPKKVQTAANFTSPNARFNARVYGSGGFTFFYRRHFIVTNTPLVRAAFNLTHRFTSYFALGRL
jgi:hypothetical protein